MAQQDRQLMFWNTFSIFYYAYYLNIHQLYGDLKDVPVMVDASGKDKWLRECFTLLTTILLVLRFLLTFAGLSASVVAIYPILTNSQPELLMPIIIVQAINDVVLNLYELLVGYGVLNYLFPQSTALFVVFLAKMVIKITCSLSSLNYYSDQHNRLVHLNSYNIEDAQSIGPSEDSLYEFELNNLSFPSD
ncbi:uncharacterized protein LOC117586513 [Drosophila guanche]|uniref:uncharacterized protein LOC117586513 n=1 Tax=Drosophila guanche TaxID=7266 RepID=UPI0014724B0F|nr:uncharacterized protein LOC117586513 [Drosophila guanche]